MATKKRELAALVEKLKKDKKKIEKEHPFSSPPRDEAPGGPAGWNPFEEIVSFFTKDIPEVAGEIFSWLPKPIQRDISGGMEALGMVTEPFEKYVAEPVGMAMMGGAEPTYPLPWMGMEEAHEEALGRYEEEYPWYVREAAQLPAWMLADLPFRGVAKGAELLRGAKALPKPKVPKMPTTPTEAVTTPEGLRVQAELAAPKGRGAKRAITIQETKALAEIGEQTPEALTEKLVKTIESAVPERVQTEILKSGELKRRVAAGARILERGTGKKAFEKAKGPLKGELPQAEFTPPELQFAPQEIDGLFDLINKAELRFFSKLNTGEALSKVLTGQIPTKGEIWMLERIFGKAFGKALRAKGGRAGRWFELSLDIANIPRSFLAAYDLSAPLRQGALLLGQPREWTGALKPMVKAFGSEKYAQTVDDIITSGENFIRREAAGLYHAPISGPGARLSQREEAFISRIASKFPGIRHSERAYVTYLNKLRADSFDNIIAGWERAGLKFGDNDIRELARFINYASGRGGLWKLEEAGPILSSLLFSPRLQLSRIQAPAMMLSSSPLVRKVAMRNFAAFFGSMTTIVTIASLMGAKVELDPRSSDFGKIRIGNTRLDPWAGYQQYARYATQMITGYRKTTSTETMQDVERGDIRDRFLRSKASPAAGLLWDIIEGETFHGEELYEGPESIAMAAKERLTPMFAQDMWEALEQEGLIGGVLALPGGLGWGVTAFEASEGHIEAMTLAESKLGTTDEEGNVYSFADFGGEANRVTKDYKTLEQFSPAVQFYRDSKTMWDAYYENTSPEPMSERIEYRERNPELDSRLFLFGKVSVLRSQQAQSLVMRYMSEYNIPPNAVGEIRIQGGGGGGGLPMPWQQQSLAPSGGATITPPLASQEGTPIPQQREPVRQAALISPPVRQEIETTQPQLPREPLVTTPLGEAPSGSPVLGEAGERLIANYGESMEAYAEGQWEKHKADLLTWATQNKMLDTLQIPWRGSGFSSATLTEEQMEQIAAIKGIFEAFDEPVVVSSEVYKRLGPETRKRVIRQPNKMSTLSAVGTLLGKVVDSVLKEVTQVAFGRRPSPKVTTSEVLAFLQDDRIDTLTSDWATYNCFNCAMQLSEAAQKQGLNLRPAFVPSARPSLHWVLWFKDEDGKIRYIEPRTDQILTEAELKRIRKPLVILRL